MCLTVNILVLLLTRKSEFKVPGTVCVQFFALKAEGMSGLAIDLEMLNLGIWNFGNGPFI